MHRRFTGTWTSTIMYMCCIWKTAANPGGPTTLQMLVSGAGTTNASYNEEGGVECMGARRLCMTIWWRSVSKAIRYLTLQDFPVYAFYIHTTEFHAHSEYLCQAVCLQKTPLGPSFNYNILVPLLVGRILYRSILSHSYFCVEGKD